MSTAPEEPIPPADPKSDTDPDQADPDEAGPDVEDPLNADPDPDPDEQASNKRSEFVDAPEEDPEFAS